ncbi:MAG: hypothetical protein Q8L86_10185 [Vicinamibacterales bacterium]|nr:hypothetical protein [Vicinamibacterales bacterium]
MNECDRPTDAPATLSTGACGTREAGQGMTAPEKDRRLREAQAYLQRAMSTLWDVGERQLAHEVLVASNDILLARRALHPGPAVAPRA